MLSTLLMAQDFTSLFLKEYKADTNLVCVTISPKMMEEILKNEKEKDEDVLEIISGLKSMQILSSRINGEVYYDEALRVIEKNQKRYDPFLSYNDEDENYRIMVRKRNDTIVELIMLRIEKSHFVVINFTGRIKPEFISTLAKSMAQKGS